MDDQQVVSPKDPRIKPKKEGSVLGALLLIGAIIGAGTWVYRDFSEDEQRIFEDCVDEIAHGRSGIHAFDDYMYRTRRACSALSMDDARDVVFVTILNVCSHDPEEKKNIEHLYRRALVNGAISFCRDRGQMSTIAYEDQLHGEKDDEDNLGLTPEQINALKKAKNVLDKEECELVKWRVDQGLSYVEIGKNMGGKDWRTAKSHVQAALNKAKEEYLYLISDP